MTDPSPSLHEAINAGDLGAVERALDAGTAIDTRTGQRFIQDQQLTALHVAILTISPNIRRIHLKANTARRHTASYRSIARLLIERGADIHAETERGRMPIHLAALAGAAELLGLLLDEGAEATARTRHGDTPLHFARTVEVARLLIENGASVHAGGYMGMMNPTPLHEARTAGIAGLLLDHGAGIDDTTGRNISSPLVCAVWARRIDVAHLLLERGASVDLADTNGQTPLHHAARYPDSGIVGRLLEYGADKEVVDCDGKTPSGLALEAGLEDNIAVLTASVLPSLGQRFWGLLRGGRRSKSAEES
ncbi:MAG: hypothetical protein BMS9Abin29_1535 [Gemmatimonadota bacterium]|nr:MAG: hypothetical protein BMS9Abin29_1535 [Gemmatimonadota bacterium]